MTHLTFFGEKDLKTEVEVPRDKDLSSIYFKHADTVYRIFMSPGQIEALGEQINAALYPQEPDEDFDRCQSQASAV